MTPQSKQRYIAAYLKYDRIDRPNYWMYYENKAEQQIITIPPTGKANGLTKAVLNFLKWNGVFAERTNTMGVYRKAKTFTDVCGFTRKIGKDGYTYSGGTKGSSDIKAYPNGKIWAIEIKIGSDKMSENQHLYKAQIEKSGGIYTIVKTFEEFLQQYDEINLSNINF